MPDERFEPGLYLMPTPAGAYRAVSAATTDPAARFLLALLRDDATPPLSDDTLTRLADGDRDAAATLFRHAEAAGWLQGSDSVEHAPSGPLEDVLAAVLPDLSTAGKVVLADPQGFNVASTGYPHESAEELAALSASLSSLQERNQGLLQGNLRLGTSAWAVVDVSGNSRVGFWPIHIGKHRFVLVIGDMPRLYHPSATRLIWALIRRYG